MVFLDITSFLGRFHPLIVHLPIGFLLLAIIFGLLNTRWQLGRATALTWLLGAISSVPAIFCGWMLAEEGGYDETTLFWHRWLGVGVGIVSLIAWLISGKILAAPKWAIQVISISVVGLLTVVGHLGGNMTHGSEYLLENAPKPIKSLLGSEDKLDTLPKLSQLDSVVVYRDMIEPIFAMKCMQCHNGKVQRGGLNMATVEMMEKGGDNGPVVALGNAMESEVYKRVVLPSDHPKYMPLKGKPMTYQEVKLMEWWLNSGSDFKEKLTATPYSKDVQNIITELFGLDLVAKPYYEKIKVEKTSDEVIQQLANQGFKVRFLATDNFLLDVEPVGTLDKQKLQSLLQIKDRITWLDLSNQNVTDDWLDVVNQLVNLTRLNLSRNPISDAGMNRLAVLQHLEAINLYETKLTNQGLEVLKKLPSLKRLYLWQTEVTSEAVVALQKELPLLSIDAGANLAHTENDSE